VCLFVCVCVCVCLCLCRERFILRNCVMWLSGLASSNLQRTRELLQLKSTGNVEAQFPLPWGEEHIPIFSLKAFNWKESPTHNVQAIYSIRGLQIWILISLKQGFTAIFKQVFDQIGGYHGLAKLAHKITYTNKYSLSFMWFFSVFILFYILTINVCRFPWFHIVTNIWCLLLNLATLVDVELYLTEVSILISLIANNRWIDR
jgi:hypothetical protein